MRSQRVQSLVLFQSSYSTDLLCLEQIVFLAASLNLLKCSKCNLDDRCEREIGCVVVYCRQCKKVTRFFESTLFKGMKCPSAWYGAIHMAEKGFVLGSNELAKIAQITEPSARSIIRKLKIVVNKLLESKSTNNDNLGSIKQPPPDLSKNSVAVISHISHIPISFDSLMEKSQLLMGPFTAALFELEMAQLVEQLPGNRFIYKLDNVDKKNAKGDVRKAQIEEIENYLKAHADEPDFVLRACLLHAPIRDSDLAEFEGSN